jgi:hypothetical protein
MGEENMANYVAHYTKKLQTLTRKKLDLKRLLSGQWTEEEVAIAAEEVRESQIRVLEAKKAQIPPCEANAQRIHSIDKEIEECKCLDVAEIVKASCQ